MRKLLLALVLALGPPLLAQDTTTHPLTILSPNGQVASGGTVTAQLSASATAGGITVPTTVAFPIAANGTVSVVLIPNDAMAPANTYYTMSFAAQTPAGTARWKTKWYVTSAPDPQTLPTVLEVPPGQVSGAYLAHAATEPAGACPAGSNPIVARDTGRLCQCVSLAWSCAGATGAGHTIQNESSALTDRSALNFVGGGVQCTDTGSTTQCTVLPSGADFPVAPAVGDYFTITDDADVGDCGPPSGGTAASLCRWNGTDWLPPGGSGSGGGVPGATYIVQSTDATLTAEKVLTGGAGIAPIVYAGTDGGTATVLTDSREGGFLRDLEAGPSISGGAGQEGAMAVDNVAARLQFVDGLGTVTVGFLDDVVGDDDTPDSIGELGNFCGALEGIRRDAIDSANECARWQDFDDELQSLSTLGGTGLLVRAAAGVIAARTISGDTEIVVTNGDGVGGNIDLDIGAAITRDTELATHVAGGDHDTRYYTETELNTSDGSVPNVGSNRMSWNNLTDVPAGFADGDDGGGGGGGLGTVRDDDGSPIVSSATALEMDSDVGFVINEPSAGVARVTLGTGATAVPGVNVASASISAPGVVTTSAQTFNGAKTFDGGVLLDDDAGTHSPVLSLVPSTATTWGIWVNNSVNDLVLFPGAAGVGTSSAETVTINNDGSGLASLVVEDTVTAVSFVGSGAGLTSITGSGITNESIDFGDDTNATGTAPIVISGDAITVTGATTGAVGVVQLAGDLGGTATAPTVLDDSHSHTDNFISDTLTSSLFVGSGSTTTAVDLATAEVAGDLPFANIAQIATDRLVGRDTAATGDAEALTVGGGLEFTGGGGIQRSALTGGDVTATAGSAVLTVGDNSVDGTDIALGSDAQGDVMYYNGTDWVRLGAGTSGDFLKTQGTGANPVWESVGVSSDVGAVGNCASGQCFNGNSAAEGSTLTFFNAALNCTQSWNGTTMGFSCPISADSLTTSATANPGFTFDDSGDTGAIEWQLTSNCDSPANTCQIDIVADQGSDTESLYFRFPIPSTSATEFLASTTTAGVMDFRGIVTGDLPAEVIVSTEIDTSGELAGIMTGETGSATGIPLLVFNQGPTIDAPIFTTASFTPRVTALACTTVGQVVVVTDDPSVSACNSSGGSSTSLCQCTVTGTPGTWVGIGGGSGGSGDIASIGPATAAGCASGDCFEGTGTESTLLSTTDFVIELDDDQGTVPGSNSFQVKNGSGTTVFSVNESGVAAVAPSSVPSAGFDDSDDTGSNLDAAITMNCPATNECDMEFQVNIGADALQTVMKLDALAGSSFAALVLTPNGTDDAADAGAIRLPNGYAIAWEAQPTGTEVQLAVNAAELMTVVGGTFDASVLSGLVPDSSISGANEAGEIDIDNLAGLGDIGTALVVTGSISIPQSATPTTDATGEVALDTTITDHQPLLQYYDGAENMTVIAIDTAELPALDNEIVKYDAATDKFVLEADAGGGGTANILDLGDDAGNDSVDLVEIATTGDTNSIFTESAADKLLIAVGNDWPKADTADVALTGDSATSFFSAGAIEAVRGGTAIDTSGSTGVAQVASGTWSVSNALPATVTYPDNSVASADILTEVRSMAWDAGSWSVDGCTAPAETAIPSAGFPTWEVSCADADTAQAYGKTKMPNGWDAGAVQFALNVHHAVSEVITCLYDVTCQCVGDGEAMNTTFTTEAAATEISITTAATADQMQTAEQSGAITCTGTCAAGDMLRWELEVDATGSGANCANTNLLSLRMEYVSNVGD